MRRTIEKIIGVLARRGWALALLSSLPMVLIAGISQYAGGIVDEVLNQIWPKKTVAEKIIKKPSSKGIETGSIKPKLLNPAAGVKCLERKLSAITEANAAKDQLDACRERRTFLIDFFRNNDERCRAELASLARARAVAQISETEKCPER